jgi:hypothetical protein
MAGSLDKAINTIVNDPAIPHVLAARGSVRFAGGDLVPV